jgi:hypothetical protein
MMLQPMIRKWMAIRQKQHQMKKPRSNRGGVVAVLEKVTPLHERSQLSKTNELKRKLLGSKTMGIATPWTHCLPRYLLYTTRFMIISGMQLPLIWIQYRKL